LESHAYPSTEGLSVYFRDITEQVKTQRELSEHIQQNQALLEFSRLVLEHISSDQLYPDALELLTTYLQVPYAEIHVWDQMTRKFVLADVAGLAATMPPHDTLPLDVDTDVRLRGGETILSQDVGADERFLERSELKAMGLRTALIVPAGSSDRPLVIVSLYGNNADLLSESKQHFVVGVATTLAEALRARFADRRTREILESITDGFIACDGDLRITNVNEKVADFWECKPDSMIGQPLESFFPFAIGGHAIASYRSALMTGNATTFESYMDESERWFETRVYPFAGGVAGYVRDVTSRKKSELQIRTLNSELERRVRERTHQLELANGELESFAYSVSHDLRAPLRAIDGFSQVLEEDYAQSIDAAGMRHLGRVRTAAQRMASLIDALLQLARIARQAMKIAPVDLTRLAHSVVDELRQGDPEREVTIRIQEGLVADGESALLRAALQNLIGNSWKFTRRSERAEIDVGRNGAGEFYVADNGAGFDMEYGSKLFGAFQRLHSAEEYEGTGIGLATVAKIVHRHQGEIRAEGQVGRGATFYFTLSTEVRATG
jgi:PAS domain S-box-containing protein